jgi:hypothetical protein
MCHGQTELRNILNQRGIASIGKTEFQTLKTIKKLGVALIIQTVQIIPTITINLKSHKFYTILHNIGPR